MLSNWRTTVLGLCAIAATIGHVTGAISQTDLVSVLGLLLGAHGIVAADARS